MFAADNTNAPVPNFSSNVVPDTAPGIVNTFAPVTSTFPPPVASTTARPAPRSTAAPVFCNVPPCNVNELPVPNPEPAPIDNTPPVTVTFPLKVFTPERVNVPVPALMIADEPLSTPLKITSEAVVIVLGAETEDAPENVSAPVFVASPSVTVPGRANPFAKARAVALSLESVVPDDKVTNPDPSAASLPTLNVPPFKLSPPLNVFAADSVKIPVPVFVSAFPETTPGTVNAAPLATSTTALPAPIVSVRFAPRFTVPAVSPSVAPPETASVFVADASPKFPLAPKLNVPPLTVTPPLKVFVPDSVKDPVPDFSSAPDPDNTPETINAFEAVTSTRPPLAPTTIPRPVPRSTDAPVLCKTPPFSVTLEPVPNPDAAPIATVPAFTVNPPLNVLAPPNVKIPAPALVKLVNPLTTLLNVTFDAVVSVVAEVSATAPEMVSNPLFTVSPNVTAPDTLNAFASVRAVTPSLINVVPDASVAAPAPNEPLLPT